ncbi:MFS transporter [Mycolicibacterium brisbanense]|uniref:MFS transporter n=1 Tax=Mycolicibacterium brisbanense TaxID=146020 RepID=A0A100VY96_9MYCO|nr:MFS transporter [Mycolicibacterium brisbanense]MCV7161012.1 MFS transporter [Mycolicibacterium brisbanense]GAS88193.1 MFS transporter [Mycolicibacterium brisbanense]
MSTRGQWGGSVLIVTENADPRNKGLYAAIPQLGNGFGILFANGSFLFLTLGFPDAFLTWAWRVPFLISVILVVIAIYMHFRVEDSEEFVRARAKVPAATSAPLLAVLRRYPIEILLAGAAFMIVNAGYYIASTYGLSYGTTVLGLRRETILVGIVASAAASIPVTLLAGYISDRVGRGRVFITGAVLHLLWVFPFFWLFNSKSSVAMGIALIVSQVTLNTMYGPLAAMFAELFAPEVRYSGMSLAYQFGAVLGGGFAPTICAALFETFQTSAAISTYWAVVGAVSLVAISILTARQRRMAAQLAL